MKEMNQSEGSLHLIDLFGEKKCIKGENVYDS